MAENRLRILMNMNIKDIEEAIRTSAPADLFAEAFRENIGRDVVVRRDRIIIQETKAGYTAKRRIEISAKVYIEGTKNNCLVQQEYLCYRDGRFKLKTGTKI